MCVKKQGFFRCGHHFETMKHCDDGMEIQFTCLGYKEITEKKDYCCGVKACCEAAVKPYDEKVKQLNDQVKEANDHGRKDHKWSCAVLNLKEAKAKAAAEYDMHVKCGSEYVRPGKAWAKGSG